MQTKDNIQAEVYSLYCDKVFGYVLNRVHSRADAEDITSDVFLKIFSRADEFNLKRSGASTYIFRVMQTTLSDFYRKNRIVYVSLEEVAEKMQLSYVNVRQICHVALEKLRKEMEK